MNAIIISILAICSAAFMWALEGTVLVPRLFNLDVGFVVFILHAVTFAVLTPFLWKEFRNLKKFSKTDYIYMGLIALFGGAIGTIAIVKALFLVNFEHLSVVIMLQQLQPVFAIILAMILLKERTKGEFYLWASVAFLASYFLVFGLHLPNMETGSNTMWAAILAVLAAFSWGSATVFGRRMAKSHQFTTITYFRAGFTTLIMLFYVAVLGKWAQFTVATPTNWIIIGTIAVSSGTVSMFLYYYGLKRVKAMVATICELAFPVSAVLLDYFINGTILSPVQWISATIMVLSIMRIGRMQVKNEQIEMVKTKKKEIDTMGGQAVINGVMMRSKTHYCIAVLSPKKKIVIMTEKLSSITDRMKWLKKPFIRGTVYLVEMLVIGIKALTWSAQQAEGDDEEPLTKKEIFFTIAGSLGLAVVLFIVVPFYLTTLVTIDKGIWFNLVDGVIRMIIFVLYLLGISMMKDVRTLFQYHGAEHKSVYCYEDEKPLTVKNVQKYSTKHARCGTSFIIIVLLVSILIYSLIVTDSWTIRLLSRVILLPVIAGVSFEFLKYSSKHVEHPLIRLFVYPGIWIQHITTKEPDDDQVKVAIASLKAVLKVSGRR